MLAFFAGKSEFPVRIVPHPIPEKRRAARLSARSGPRSRNDVVFDAWQTRTTSMFTYSRRLSVYSTSVARLPICLWSSSGAPSASTRS
jgi:hypothetical protein